MSVDGKVDACGSRGVVETGKRDETSDDGAESVEGRYAMLVRDYTLSSAQLRTLLYVWRLAAEQARHRTLLPTPSKLDDKSHSASAAVRALNHPSSDPSSDTVQTSPEPEEMM